MKDGTINDVIKDLPHSSLEALMHDWPIWAREDQLPPEGNWLIWLILGGRGSGKTRAGAEWVRGIVSGREPFAAGPYSRIALIGQSIADVRDVMIEGVSGLLSVHPRSERPTWLPSRRRLEWSNGAIAQVFSAEDPEGLRGPQFDAAWSDELAKWKYPQATWDMLQFALRLGKKPRQVVTTTPKSIPLLKQLLKGKRTVVSRSATSMNEANLAPGFLQTVVERYAGTRLGRQELEGELIEDRSDALWSRNTLEAMRVEDAPDITRTLVAIDPPASSGKNADACGIVVVALGTDGMGYILKDASAKAQKPLQWASRAVSLFHRFEADSLVAEVNQGGEMIAALIGEVDRHVPVMNVRATRGKWIRAEPVAALYEQGRIRHVGNLSELEDEMCDFGLDGLSSGHSPDRVDALVWGLTALMLNDRADPRIRHFR